MNYLAEVTRPSIHPELVDHFVITPILAINTIEAARHAAQVAARRYFPNDGEVSFFSQSGDRFLAAIGRYKFANGHGINVGASISIRVQAVE